MRLMMVEFTATNEDGVVTHGVCNRRRLEHVIEEGSIVAKMIEDDAAAKLQAKWEGDIEPVVKAKSHAPFIKAEEALKEQRMADAARAPTSKSQMAASMPPSGITRK